MGLRENRGERDFVSPLLVSSSFLPQLTPVVVFLNSSMSPSRFRRFYFVFFFAFSSKLSLIDLILLNIKNKNDPKSP